MADMPPVVKAADVTARTGTSYLPQYAVQLKGREKRVLGDLFGLTQFGVNLMSGGRVHLCAGRRGVPHQ